MTAQATAEAKALLHILHTRIYDKRNKCYGWKPTPGQVKVGKSLLVDGKKRIFIQCGRKWGKTEFVIYLLLRWAVLNSGSTCAYFGPKRNLARTIIWKRLKTFIPKEFLKDGSMDAFKEQTLEVRLWNGSTIVVDGTADPDSGRGVEPHIVVYDEYKDHKDGFREAMEANLEVFNAVEVFIGTPPDHANHFTEMAEEIKNDPDGFFIEAPSKDGPVYGTPEGLKKLEKIRAKYERIGDLAYYYREYEGRFVRGGKGAIFPMWKPEEMIYPALTLENEISKDKLRHNWFIIFDPGSTTVFAALVACINPYTKTVYLLDEIYETDPMQTSTGRIWPRAESLMMRHCSQLAVSDMRWYKGYDEAAAWFANELADLTGGRIGLTPTNKKLINKENGLSLIKDQMLRGRLRVSERCPHYAQEVINYVKKENGEIPKENDHLIDCIAKGSLIQTTKGLKPIEDIKIGECVWTKMGKDKVIDVWLVGPRKTLKLNFSNNKTIICTPEHRIFTNNRGFIEARSLTSSDIFDNIKIWKKLLSLPLMGLFSEGIQTLKEGVIDYILDAIQPITKVVLDIFIGSFTNRYLVKFQKATISTIKIIIHLITTLPIWNLKKAQFTLVNIIKEFLHQPRLKISIILDILQKNGTVAQRGLNGTVRTLKKLGYLKRRLIKFVCAVPSLIKQRFPINLSSVAKPVKLVSVEEGPIILVYDITTEKYNQFYTNDILVHNCHRYLNAAAGYTFDPEKEAQDRFKEAGWRGARPADDYDLEDHFGLDDDFL